MKMSFYRFRCTRCGYQFFKYIYPPPVIRCPKCTDAVIAKDSDRLSDYAKMKLYWIKHPQAWDDNIKHRQLVGKGKEAKAYLTDDHGYRRGELIPE